jgi:hypothetical protein
MRLWSLHPRYLDPQGLVALWREGLLAQKVLRGLTRGYRHHPQLERFRSQKDPVVSIGKYLSEIFREAERRGYAFNRRRIFRFSSKVKPSILVTKGQIVFEKTHLFSKLQKRSPEVFNKLKALQKVEAHPFLKVRPGRVELWEKTNQRKRS